MFTHSLAFDSPEYLWLLLVIPVIWRLSYQRLAALGRWRRIFALSLRSVVAASIILSLADVQLQRRSEGLTVVYVLDQSLSIPVEQRQAMLEYVNASIDQHRKDQEHDRFAVIVFGRDAEIEVPPIDYNAAAPARVESLVDREYTDLASAIQRAKAIFPHDAAKRITLVTDGNQNLGDAYREARAAAEAGVSIDVVPVLLDARTEVAVEKVDLPAGVRRGQPFEMRVVLSNDDEASDGRPVEGKLTLIRKSGDREDPVSEVDVVLPPGKRVFSISETINEPDFYTYEARFTPDDPRADAMTQNNRASAFTHVRGKGQVLLIENWETAGDFDLLAERLRAADIAVEVRGSDRLFTSLAELQRYDAIILGNVSRSAGSDVENVVSFTDEQISMLIRNTRELGCGLIMIGGPDTYGAGGWTGTELEEAMPVDFQIKSGEVVPVGALVLMMHAGEMPRSNYWQKRIAVESIKILGARDFAGLVQWNQTDQWLWAPRAGGLVRVGGNRKMMLSRVDRMAIGDMPAFDGAMKMAAAAFAGLPPGAAAVKHMIIISDGDPTPPTAATINALKQQNVTVTTVGVDSHGMVGSPTMQRIAQQTGGKYYRVKSGNALPKIYQREARRVARPLVFEPRPPVVPQIVTNHEMLRGVEDAIPPISGFVLTSVKENALVDVILRSPLPVAEKNSTVLAAWTYGAGKSVALTTDAGTRWASSWSGWEGYDKLFTQMVRWAMRPTDNAGNLTVATDQREGKTEIVVTALDANDEFLNNLAMSATVVAPDMSTRQLPLEQTAPGRYVGQFDSEEAGSYLVVVNPGGDMAPLRTGVNVGYSPEYRDNETNLALLESLARLPAEGGGPGVFVEDGLLRVVQASDIPQDPFRRDLPPARSSQPIWPWLVVLGSCLFWGDVFVRRVQVGVEWVTPWLVRMRDRVLRRQAAAAVPETMSRLRSRKQQISQQLEQRKTTRFESTEGQTGDERPVATPLERGPSERTPARPADVPAPETPDASDETSYTERLLKAKKQVWRDRPQGDEPPPGEA